MYIEHFSLDIYIYIYIIYVCACLRAKLLWFTKPVNMRFIVKRKVNTFKNN